MLNCVMWDFPASRGAREHLINYVTVRLANLKLTYRVQIEHSAHQNDDKRDSKDGKVQHDFSLITTLFC